MEQDLVEQAKEKSQKQGRDLETVLLTLVEQLKFHESEVLKRQLGQLHEQNRNQDSFNTNIS